ncbi:hypothetical protein ACEWY4_001368 [Coilia grayii]|uniref:ribonuclease H n=1 Tax=Coilia grayii TaxID=363190 RepID=A0ABD1KSS4_9TELE
MLESAIIVDDLVERLGKAKYLSTLDLRNSYWQVPLAAEAQELTAFRVSSGLYHFPVMPFGLHRSVASFQRLMAEDDATAYIDDVVIFSASWEDHLSHLRDVFQSICQAGLVAQVSPGQARGLLPWLCPRGGVIKPQVEKVEAIRSGPPLTTKKGV